MANSAQPVGQKQQAPKTDGADLAKSMVLNKQVQVIQKKLQEASKKG